MYNVNTHVWTFISISCHCGRIRNNIRTLIVIDFGLNEIKIETSRLEIQADVISTKRHSLSSETASVCLSMDDGGAGASTRGLAGSVLSYKANIEDSKSETASTRGLAGSVLSYKANIEDSKSETSCGGPNCNSTQCE